MEKYRLRDRQLNIRIADHEYQLIMERFKASGKNSLREFIVDTVINGYIINVDYKEIKGLAYEINKIGNNINQLARKANAGFASRDEATRALRMLDRVYELMYEFSK